MKRGGFEREGDLRSHLSAREERLGIARGNDVQLAVVIELADRKERLAWGRRPKGERTFEVLPPELCRSAPGQQSLRVLPRDA